MMGTHANTTVEHDHVTVTVTVVIHTGRGGRRPPRDREDDPPGPAPDDGPPADPVPGRCRPRYRGASRRPVLRLIPGGR